MRDFVRQQAAEDRTTLIQDTEKMLIGDSMITANKHAYPAGIECAVKPDTLAMSVNLHLRHRIMAKTRFVALKRRDISMLTESGTLMWTSESENQ